MPTETNKQQNVKPNQDATTNENSANSTDKKPVRRSSQGNNFNKKHNVKDKLYDEKVVSINRVTKVTKGGRQFKFSAIVLVGDKKGRVGLGTGKANEVPDAIKKAIRSAEKSLVRIPIVGTTVPHEVIGTHSGGKVLIKPAKTGKGIIAGGPVRLMMELSGIKDVYSKSLGSNTPINMIRATLDGFAKLKTAEQFLMLKDKLPKAEDKVVKEDNKE